MKKIKVVIIDETLLTCKLLTQGLKNDTNFEIVEKVYDISVAKKVVVDTKPNVVVVDMKMSKINGVDFIRDLFGYYKVPIVAVSTKKEDEALAKKAGAYNFALKPKDALADMSMFYKQLVMGMSIASVVKYENAMPAVSAEPKKTNTIIAIGASTGGTEAILKVVKGLRKSNLPPIIIVQHMPPVFTKTYSERLNRECALTVKEAEDNDALVNDRVIIAEGEHHLTLAHNAEKQWVVRSQKGERVSSHCPSVDVMFESVARIMKPNDNVMGIILTGMGKDGARGLLSLRRKGAYTVGQDEESCVVYGMPMEAYELGAVVKQLPLDKIADEIHIWVNRLRKDGKWD